MKIKSYLHKIRKRIQQFEKHPVTQKAPLKAFFRYLFFNVISFFKREITYHWIGSLRFYARKGDAGIVANIYFGLYEFEDSIFLLHFVSDKDLFFDVGSNLGHYSLLLSGIKGCDSYAFEPVPDTYDQMVRNIELNQLQSKIHIKNIGFAEHEDTLFFTTHRGTMNRIAKQKTNSSVAVKVTSLDAFCKQESKIPTVLKIDVEGFEYFVLKGASSLLSTPELKVLLIEFNSSGHHYGIDDETVFEILTSYGFKPYSYDFSNRKLLPLLSFDQHKFNTLMIRDELFVENKLKSNYQVEIFNQLF